jgi:hypothetical protein
MARRPVHIDDHVASVAQRSRIESKRQSRPSVPPDAFDDPAWEKVFECAAITMAGLAGRTAAREWYVELCRRARRAS